MPASHEHPPLKPLKNPDDEVSDPVQKIEKLFWQMKLFFRLPLMALTFGEAAYSISSQNPTSTLAESSSEIAALALGRLPLVLLVETMFLGSQTQNGLLSNVEAVKVIAINGVLATLYFFTMTTAMAFGASFGSVAMFIVLILAFAALVSLTHSMLIPMIMPVFGMSGAAVAQAPGEKDSSGDSCCDSAFGQCQSPININFMNAIIPSSKNKVVNEEEFQKSPLHFHYPTKIANCSILNNGYTVQVDMNQKRKCTLSIHNKTYTLRQFHFHTPSEHTMNSVQYEMEMHLVHTTEDNDIGVLGFVFSTNPACKPAPPVLKRSASRNHLLLASIGEDVEPVTESEAESETDLPGIEEDKDGNKFLAQFWHQLPATKTEKNIPLDRSVSFDYLFETAGDSFSKTVKTGDIDVDMELFEYVGSLTTPPFTEGVQWLLSHKLHYMSPQQLVSLKKCWGNVSNAREVQDVNKRDVSLRRRNSLRRTE